MCVVLLRLVWSHLINVGVCTIKVPLGHLIGLGLVPEFCRFTQIIDIRHSFLQLGNELLLIFIGLHHQNLLLKFNVLTYSWFQILKIFVVTHQVRIQTVAASCRLLRLNLLDLLNYWLDWNRLSTLGRIVRVINRHWLRFGLSLRLLGCLRLSEKILVSDHSVGEFVLRLKAVQKFRNFVLDERVDQNLVDRRSTQRIHLQTTVHELFHFHTILLWDGSVITLANFLTQHDNIACVNWGPLAAHFSK